MKKELKKNDNIQFIISADWDSKSSSQLLVSTIAEWIKILTGVWVEEYIAANKNTTQKSKG